MLNDLRKGAEIHRNVRKYAQTLLKPGIDALDFCNKLEEMNRKLNNYQGITNVRGYHKISRTKGQKDKRTNTFSENRDCIKNELD